MASQSENKVLKPVLDEQDRGSLTIEKGVAVRSDSETSVATIGVLCEHCQQLKQRYSRTVTIIRMIINSCKQIEDVIHHSFQDDTCICYPNYINLEDSLLELSQDIIFPRVFHTEFIEHLLRLVRPSNNEQEDSLVHSRIVRDFTGVSKVLIPVVIDRKSNCVVRLGYTQCYGSVDPQHSPRASMSGMTNESKHNGVHHVEQRTSDALFAQGHKIVEIVVDYDPPSLFTPIPYRFRTSTTQKSPPEKKWMSLCFENNAFGDESLVDGCTNHKCLEFLDAPDFHGLGAVDKDNKVSINLHHALKNCCKPQRSCPSPVFTNVSPLQISASYYACRGRRSQMEDRVVVLMDLHKKCKAPPLPQNEKVCFLAIYDGHGGTEVVDYVSRHFHYGLTHSDFYKNGDMVNALRSTFKMVEWSVSCKLKMLIQVEKKQQHLYRQLKQAGIPTGSITDPWGTAPSATRKHNSSISALLDPIQLDCTDHDVDRGGFPGGVDPGKDSIQKSIGEAETEVRRLEKLFAQTSIGHSCDLPCDSPDHPKASKLTSGSTASVVLIRNRILYIANLGDSRCILSRNGRIACLTEDHRLGSSKREVKRINNTPGTFTSDGYLCGQLAVSRAFGNVEHRSGTKLLGLLSSPDILSIPIRDDDEFLIIGCDGLFDTLTPIDAALLVRETLEETNDLQCATKTLVNKALERSDDNVSAILVVFNQHTTRKPRVASDSSPPHDAGSCGENSAVDATGRRDVSPNRGIPHDCCHDHHFLDDCTTSYARSRCPHCYCKPLPPEDTSRDTTPPHASPNASISYVRKR